jgi:hypothetical protein
MTNPHDSMEIKTSNPRQQGELRSLRFSNGRVCQVHGKNCRLTEEEERKLLLEIINEAENILKDNADLNNPSSA